VWRFFFLFPLSRNIGRARAANSKVKSKKFTLYNTTRFSSLSLIFEKKKFEKSPHCMEASRKWSLMIGKGLKEKRRGNSRKGVQQKEKKSNK
jgi:hypothetical protein